LRSRERARQLGEDRQVGVQSHTVKPSHAQRRELPTALEASELTFH
jgi:hypothetical protein